MDPGCGKAFVPAGNSPLEPYRRCGDGALRCLSCAKRVADALEKARQELIDLLEAEAGEPELTVIIDEPGKG